MTNQLQGNDANANEQQNYSEPLSFLETDSRSVFPTEGASHWSEKLRITNIP
jgi:hypothetical protein